MGGSSVTSYWLYSFSFPTGPCYLTCSFVGHLVHGLIYGSVSRLTPVTNWLFQKSRCLPRSTESPKAKKNNTEEYRFIEIATIRVFRSLFFDSNGGRLKRIEKKGEQRGRKNNWKRWLHFLSVSTRSERVTVDVAHTALHLIDISHVSQAKRWAPTLLLSAGILPSLWSCC